MKTIFTVKMTNYPETKKKKWLFRSKISAFKRLSPMFKDLIIASLEAHIKVIKESRK